jgi:NAD(P)-dependent dehydrogenase (short-subunit alcohol dehydrogenase family)
MRSFRGKKALVTGAASGIGSAIVMALAKEGTSLWLVDIDEASLASTAREAESHGVTVVTSVCDLADPEQITAVVGSVLSTWGDLNILVNSAGITHYGPMHLITGDQWQRILSVNLLAPIQLVRELFATLVAQDDAHISQAERLSDEQIWVGRIHAGLARRIPTARFRHHCALPWPCGHCHDGERHESRRSPVSTAAALDLHQRG